MFRMIGKTHPGAVREHNEDAFHCDSENRLAVVADGMGGYAAGEVASEITVKTLAELKPAAGRLVAALVECHERIIQHSEQHPESKGMGAAVVAASLGESRLSVCWAGDSRAYLFDGVELKPVSRDHSYVQWLLSQGQITEEQARTHPERNLVTQCLGLQPPQPELTTIKWNAGDLLLLCSDGLTDELTDGEISDCLANATSTDEAAEQLVEKALAAGGRDNVTVVLAENLSSGKSEDDRSARKQTPSAFSARKPPTGNNKSLGVATNPWIPAFLGIGAAIVLLVLVAGIYWLI